MMHRSTLYMVDSSFLFVVSISGKLYHMMLNNESQLVCDVENVLSLFIVSNKHSIESHLLHSIESHLLHSIESQLLYSVESQLLHSLRSLDGHDGCIQRGSRCINALLRSLQEKGDLDHSTKTTNYLITFQKLE